MRQSRLPNQLHSRAQGWTPECDEANVLLAPTAVLAGRALHRDPHLPPLHGVLIEPSAVEISTDSPTLPEYSHSASGLKA